LRFLTLLIDRVVGRIQSVGNVQPHLHLDHVSVLDLEHRVRASFDQFRY
jgi:hypothetical protein